MAANVVNLSDHERVRRTLSPAESGRMLNDCRELAMRRLARSLRGMLSDVEAELFRMAEATYDRELQNLYLEARGKAKENWSRIELAFSRQFAETFNRKARGELDAAMQPLAVSAGELRLRAGTLEHPAGAQARLPSSGG